jgi:hypothetical protein
MHWVDSDISDSTSTGPLYLHRVTQYHRTAHNQQRPNLGTASALMTVLLAVEDLQACLNVRPE